MLKTNQSKSLFSRLGNRLSSWKTRMQFSPENTREIDVLLIASLEADEEYFSRRGAWKYCKFDDY